MDTTNLTAPDISPGYPSKGRRLNQAWTKIWAELTEAGSTFTDGTEVADRVREPLLLARPTLLGLLSRAVEAGFLEREYRVVEAGRGPRKRAFYRIKGTTDHG